MVQVQVVLDGELVNAVRTDWPGFMMLRDRHLDRNPVDRAAGGGEHNLFHVVLPREIEKPHGRNEVRLEIVDGIVVRRLGDCGRHQVERGRAAFERRREVAAVAEVSFAELHIRCRIEIGPASCPIEHPDAVTAPRGGLRGRGSQESRLPQAGALGPLSGHGPLDCPENLVILVRGRPIDREAEVLVRALEADFHSLFGVSRNHVPLEHMLLHHQDLAHQVEPAAPDRHA